VISKKCFLYCLCSIVYKGTIRDAWLYIKESISAFNLLLYNFAIAKLNTNTWTLREIQ